MQNMRAELSCPITLDLFVDPINVPCCGKAVNRKALLECFENHIMNCPMCGQNIQDFDIMGAAKNVNLAGLVDILQSQNNNNNQNNLEHKWDAKLIPLIGPQKQKLSIAEFKLNLKDAKFSTKPCLFIAVVDQSGSMAGRAWSQVQLALVHIMSLTHRNQLVKTQIITYQSFAQVVNMENKSLEHINTTIGLLKTGGDTFW